MGRIEVRALENGKPISSAVAAMWTAFLNGRWTRERPSRPGKYVIANRDGRAVGEVFVFFDAETEELTVRVRDGALCEIKELEDPTVWWWSKPMPQLMPLGVPGALRHRSARGKRPSASELREMNARARRYEAEQRRELMAQVGLHEMPKWEDNQ